MLNLFRNCCLQCFSILWRVLQGTLLFSVSRFYFMILNFMLTQIWWCMEQSRNSCNGILGTGISLSIKMKETVVLSHFSVCTFLSTKCPIVWVVREAGTEPTQTYSSKIPPLCCYPKDACELLLLQCDSSHVYFHSLLSLADFGSAKINILCLVMWPFSIWQTPICFLPF